MKKVTLVLVIITSVLVIGCTSEKKKTEKQQEKIVVTNTNFGVRGNCGMCKKTIEKAANSVEGVTAAVWNKTKKKIEVSFDATKTNVTSIEKAIAAAGYDTENTLGNTDAYKELPTCCKYDHEMKMNQTGNTIPEEVH